ncbi:MAG: YhbY family RNA-binding protein [Candidatus Woesearchaeota archaeon]
MTSIDLNKLKKESVKLPILVRIGKTGITDSLIEEINKHLKKRKLIKIKFLKSSLIDSNVDELALLISKKTESKLVLVIGMSATFYKDTKKN